MPASRDTSLLSETFLNEGGRSASAPLRFALGFQAASKRRAFTLVELMCAVAVLSLLVLLLSGVFNHASRTWIQGEGSIERRRSARAIMETMAGELQLTVLPVETFASGTGGNLQFVVNPSQVGDDYRNADAIFWQAPLATELSCGDLAAIGYFVRWLDTEAGKRPTLCRFFANPSRKNGSQTEPNPDHLVYASATNAWCDERLIEELAPATRVEGYVGLFAENIVGLWIRCFGPDGRELPKAFDSRAGYSTQREWTGRGGVRTWTEQRYLPASVELSFAQVDSHHAQRIGPVWEALRELTKSSDVVDAKSFLAEFQKSAQGSPGLAALAPGIRIHSTEVRLPNSR